MSGARRLLRDSRGVSIIEVLIAALLLGIATAGVTLMFGTGQAFIVGEGDNRVALALARQAVEQVRASGFGPTMGADPREEPTFNATAYGTTHPGYERSITIASVCANDFLPACSPPTPIEAKLVTVTVRAIGGVQGTNVAASPVVLRSVMVLK
ncbi:MAG TPA: prepilin-type N-terminal cleavage/methylation domain-containing protein [Methylomirabilota bacterium]|nr:prepilin-type N-terminal cleavage/methylation domain-containing protein [Methylomirabilota bacterium]